MLCTENRTQPPAHPFDSGDVGALYERYAARVRSFVYRRTGDCVLADDITAETFLQALQAISHYEDRGLPITAWLLRIAANEVAEHGRRRHGWVTTDTLAFTEVLASTDLGPEEISEGNEWARWRHGVVSTLLASLPADQRRAVLLRYGEERHLAEIAVELGRSVGAVKALLHRAMTLLRSGGTTSASLDLAF